ncbi:MAG: DGQHR domain-containing protein [bacterium]|nr:DGQHR domain-containing protein [bacterium]
MQAYPALKAQMGRWEYYMVRMSMRELAENVKFAEEVHGTNHLSEAIQRELKTSRATGQIAGYLSKQPDRFFSSIVVAALEGEPIWWPVSLENDPQFNMLRKDRRIKEAFGVLQFNGEQNYYALDGQHRLAAIRTLIEGSTDHIAPDSFRNEDVPVIIVTPSQSEDTKEFLIRYRRLFGNLNRYAKSMSPFDSYVMDEDDAIAIITRRLVTNHEFFSSVGSQFESSKVKMKPGKNVTPGSTHWTSFEMLYELNVGFLNSAARRNKGWGKHLNKLDEYKRFRPDEEEIDALGEELSRYWTALLEAMPVLREEPSRMRIHNPESKEDEDNKQDVGQDNILFWPITQEMLISIARELLDIQMARQNEVNNILELDMCIQALKPLSHISWDAHQAPWKHILLVKSEGADSPWRIVNEDRKKRIRLGERLVRYQLGLDNLSNLDLEDEYSIKSLWSSYIPAFAQDELEPMWQQILDGVLVGSD